MVSRVFRFDIRSRPGVPRAEVEGVFLLLMEDVLGVGRGGVKAGIGL